jgi:hypothetical protein
MDSIIEMASDNFGTTRISRHKDILANIALFKVNMVL